MRIPEKFHHELMFYFDKRVNNVEKYEIMIPLVNITLIGTPNNYTQTKI